MRTREIGCTTLNYLVIVVKTSLVPWDGGYNNKDNLLYPQDNRIRHGHRGNDYIVPFIPLYTHEDMFKTADNFGYKYPDMDDDVPTDEPNTDGTGSSEPDLAVSTKACNILILGLTLAVVVFVEGF